MITLGNRRVLLGGFHDHWARTNTDNPTLLMAAMSYYHYDFICLMDGESERRTQRAIEAYCPAMKVYLGEEQFMSWGHIITVNARERVILPPDTDPRTTFAAMEEANEFVAMAHPTEEERADKMLLLEEVGRLMDAGVIKATQFIRSPTAREWLKRRDAAGKVTPIVSGWDVHLVMPLKNLPAVLYGPDRSPDGHLDSCDGHRTLVLAEENTLSAIKAAILRGDSVVEDVHSGELFGSAKCVAFLEANGYREAVARLNARRDACRLSVDAKAVAGEPATLRFSTPGAVRMPGTLLDPRELATGPDGILRTGPLPTLLDRDMTYLPVVKTEPDGTVRAWAIEMHHPVQLDILPVIRAGRPAIELRPTIPFKGDYALQVEGAAEVTGNATQMEFPCPLADVSGAAVDCRLRARSATGVERETKTLLTYAQAPAWRDGWDPVPAIDVADTCVPRLKSLFGANRPYPGRDVYSGRLQFAWTPDEFRVRVRVVDPMHFQPMEGHFMYYGDSLQLALDPLLRRADGVGTVYVFNFCLGPKGPEVFRWQRPDDGLAPGYKAKPGNVSIGGQYLTVTPWARGLIYELRLPWSELAPAQPAAGLRMGAYFIMFNNDGQGLLDTLHWPRPIEGMWLVPRRWGVVSLT
jgi:hypothetical protein